jgi:hypothetical protein
MERFIDLKLHIDSRKVVPVFFLVRQELWLSAGIPS